jgi:nucleoside-triphosphatase THEP1
VNDILTPSICILTGEENIGKSTNCRYITEYANLKKIAVSGIRSELEIINNQKKAINSFDIKTGEMMKLAFYSPGWDQEKPERKWKFNQNAFNWGNNVLRRSVPTNLLIIDEIGYLELEKGEGWNECFNVLESNQYQLALIVIRPELLPLASQRFERTSFYTLNNSNKIEIKKKLIDKLNRLV